MIKARLVSSAFILSSSFLLCACSQESPSTIDHYGEMAPQTDLVLVESISPKRVLSHKEYQFVFSPTHANYADYAFIVQTYAFYPTQKEAQKASCPYSVGGFWAAPIEQVEIMPESSKYGRFSDASGKRLYCLHRFQYYSVTLGPTERFSFTFYQKEDVPTLAMVYLSESGLAEGNGTRSGPWYKNGDPALPLVSSDPAKADLSYCAVDNCRFIFQPQEGVASAYRLFFDIDHPWSLRSKGNAGLKPRYSVALNWYRIDADGAVLENLGLGIFYPFEQCVSITVNSPLGPDQSILVSISDGWVGYMAIKAWYRPLKESDSNLELAILGQDNKEVTLLANEKRRELQVSFPSYASGYAYRISIAPMHQTSLFCPEAFRIQTDTEPISKIYYPRIRDGADCALWTYLTPSDEGIVTLQLERYGTLDLNSELTFSIVATTIGPKKG